MTDAHGARRGEKEERMAEKTDEDLRKDIEADLRAQFAQALEDWLDYIKAEVAEGPRYRERCEEFEAELGYRIEKELARRRLVEDHKDQCALPLAK
jgi:hypothetical protein